MTTSDDQPRLVNLVDHNVKLDNQLMCGRDHVFSTRHGRRWKNFYTQL